MGEADDLGLVPIRIALLSVADKRGLLELATALDRLAVTLGCTDGTYSTLYTQGLETELLSRYVRPLLDGRVRTFYPELHAPIAATTGELAALAEVGLEPIDLVVCNPAWFALTAERRDVTLAMASDAIDGGGIALIRAAARSWARVAVVVDPDDYPAIVAELERTGGALGAVTRLRLAAKAFAVTAEHDARVAAFLADVVDRDATIARPRLPALVTGPWRPADLAIAPASGALYAVPPAPIATGDEPPPAIVAAGHAAGDPTRLTAAVVRDLDRALAVVRELDPALAIAPAPGAAAVIVRDDEPVSASALGHPLPAIEHALAFAGVDEGTADGLPPVHGGALALDVPITLPLVRALAGSGLDAIVAPAIAGDARAAWPAAGPAVVIARGRWHDPPGGTPWLPPLAWRTIAGGLLVEEQDVAPIASRLAACVTARAPTDDERRDLELAARVARHVRAHALVIAHHAGVVAVSGGAPDLRRALLAAHVGAEELLHGAVAAVSVRLDDPLDVDALAAAGVRAVLQPGGSPADMALIAAADRHGLAMLMHGVSHERR